MGPEAMIDRDDVATALDRALASFVDVVRRAASRPGAAILAVPGSTWSVAETVAHVSSLHRRAISDFRRSATPEETAGLNAACLDEDPERDLRVLADRLEVEGATAHANLRALPVDLPFPFHAGTTTTVVPASGVVLAEYLVHGWEVERALDGGEPTVDPHAARTAMQAFAPLLAGWHRPGADLTVAFRLAALDEIVTVASNDRDLTLRFDLDQGHAAIEVDAGELLLAFPFRRRPMPPGSEALIERIAPV